MADKQKKATKTPVAKAPDLGKEALIKAVASKTDLSQKDVSSVLDALVGTVVDTVKGGGKVKLIGFGSFEKRSRAAREGRNPATGATINIPSQYVPAFKPGQAFKDACN